VSACRAHYLSSWCSGRAAGRAVGVGGGPRRSGARSRCSHRGRGSALPLGTPGGPGSPHGRGSRWNTLSGGRSYEEPPGSPYCEGERERDSEREREICCLIILYEIQFSNSVSFCSTMKPDEKATDGSLIT